MGRDDTQALDLSQATSGSQGPGTRNRLPFAVMLPRAIVSLLLTIAFFLLGHLVATSQPLRLDRWMAETMHADTGNGWERIMRVVTEFGSGTVTVPLTLIVVGWLIREKRKQAATVIVVFWIGSKIIDQAAKAWYHRERPSFFPHVVDAGGYSYPSGHTVTALMTYGLIAAVLFHCVRGPRRWIAFGLAALMTLCVAASRIVLGVHYLSDVTGSMLIAGAWLQTAIIVLIWAEPCGDEQEKSGASTGV
jgi:undecaprenyl-diphosphatase